MICVGTKLVETPAPAAFARMFVMRNVRVLLRARRNDRYTSPHKSALRGRGSGLLTAEHSVGALLDTTRSGSLRVTSWR